MQQDRSDLVSAVAEGGNQIGQIALVGFGFAVGCFRAQNARDRRVDDVEQDQLALTPVCLDQAQGTVQDLGVGLVVLERDTDSCQPARPQRLHPVELHAGLGQPGGDERTDRLESHPHKEQGRAAGHAVQAPATSQLTGIGPNRAVNPAA